MSNKKAVTTAAQIKRTWFFKELRQTIRKGIFKASFRALALTDAQVEAKISSILREFIPNELEVPTNFINSAIEQADLMFSFMNNKDAIKDLQACFIIGAICGYFHPAVFDGPSMLDRLQLDHFMMGVCLGEDQWSEENYTGEEQ